MSPFLDLNRKIVLDPYEPFVTVKDDFTYPNALDPYWAGWTTAPAASYNVGIYGTLIQPTVTGQNGTTCFLYKTENITAGRSIQTCVACSPTQMNAGLRMDDGTDNNYLELLYRSVANPQSGFILWRYREGGGAVTETSLFTPWHTAVMGKMRIVCSTTSTFFLYYDGTSISDFDATYAAGSARAYTRHGIFVRATTASSRLANFHWYATNF